MARPKSIKAANRAAFNTTIDKNIANMFREKCQEYGLAINIVLEKFMEKFATGEFYVDMNINITKHNQDDVNKRLY